MLLSGFLLPASLQSKPHYTIRDDKVLYTKAVFSCIPEGLFEFLRYCQPHLQTQIPSGMPDWSKLRLVPMLQEGVYLIFTPYYEPYKASDNLVGNHRCGQIGSEIPFLTASGKLVDIIEDVTGDYDRQSP